MRRRVLAGSTLLVALLGVTAALWLKNDDTLAPSQMQDSATVAVALRVEGMT